VLTLPPTIPIYLCAEPVDLRRGFDGLVAAARERVARDPRQGGLFLFCNRRRSQLRALCFDRNGLVLLGKRLDRGTFAWPRPAPDAAVVHLDVRELALLLAGLPLPGRGTWSGSAASSPTG
jgi:transposase